MVSMNNKNTPNKVENKAINPNALEKLFLSNFQASKRKMTIDT